jgi:CrcB protein
MMMLLYAAAGGAIGAALRYLMTSKITQLVGAAFPYGTMAVNVLGSFAMGALIAWMVKTLPHSEEFRTLVAVGILGGFTTFSAFSLDAMNLLDRGDVMSASGYIVGSVLLSILALIAGMWLVRGMMA